MQADKFADRPACKQVRDHAIVHQTCHCAYHSRCVEKTDRQTRRQTCRQTDGRTDGRTRRVFSTKAYPTLFLASSVSAQPSTAMSCVAAMSTSKKKSAVIDATSALSTLHLTSNIVSPSKKKSAMVDTTSALSTCKKRATQSRKCQQCLEWLQHA